MMNKTCASCKYDKTGGPCYACGPAYRKWEALPMLEDISEDTCYEGQNIRNDVIEHPAHYTQGGIECIDAIQAALTPEEFRGYLKGNIIKYIWRERFKAGVESIKKAMWYTKKLIEFLRAEE